MRIYYHLTGSKRKPLVAAISQELQEPVAYLGAPTFAFQVGDYHIDRHGTVTGKDNLDLEDALYRQGFSSDEREYDEPDTEESGLGGLGATPSVEELQNDAQAWAERQMRRLKLENENVPDFSNSGPYGGDAIPDFEDLQMTEAEELGLGKRRREHWQGENGMQADDCIPSEPETLTIELPLDGFTKDNLANLEKLIASKAGLIKKALGIAALPIVQTDTTLQFPWFAFGSPGDDIAAYSRFIGALYAAAKKHKRVTAKEKQVENELFTFRIFLISLGFVGDDYKAARKILLRNLSGNSAYAKPERRQEVEDHA
jgi:hypothetical protein